MDRWDFHGFSPFFYHPAIGYPIYGTPHIARFVEDESISPSPNTRRLLRAVWLRAFWLVTCGFPMGTKRTIAGMGKNGKSTRRKHGFVWKCWVYSQWNSHLIGIRISKTIGFRDILFSDTPTWEFQMFCSFFSDDGIQCVGWKQAPTGGHLWNIWTYFNNIYPLVMTNMAMV